MKKTMKSFAKINVLSCEPKFMQGSTTLQERDNEGNAIWILEVLKEELDEKHGIVKTDVVKHKSFEKLEKGEHFVELKSAYLGQGSGDFIQVKDYHKIVRKLEGKLSLEQLFAAQGVIPPSKRAKVEANAQARQ